MLCHQPACCIGIAIQNGVHQCLVFRLREQCVPAIVEEAAAAPPAVQGQQRNKVVQPRRAAGTFERIVASPVPLLPCVRIVLRIGAEGLGKSVDVIGGDDSCFLALVSTANRLTQGQTGEFRADVGDVHQTVDADLRDFEAAAAAALREPFD